MLSEGLRGVSAGSGRKDRVERFDQPKRRLQVWAVEGTRLMICD